VAHAAQQRTAGSQQAGAHQPLEQQLRSAQLPVRVVVHVRTVARCGARGSRAWRATAWAGTAEKPYAGADWLRYLIDTFLRPGAAARTDRSGRFDGFTFDHHLDGALVGSVSESGALVLLRIDDGDVSEVGLLAPDPTDLCDPRTHARRARSDAARGARWERWVAAVAADEA